MLEDQSAQTSNDGSVAEVCKMCGVRLNGINRSAKDPNLCKMCAGEQDDPNDFEDFK